MEQSKYLSVALRAVKKAEAVVMDNFGKELKVEFKSDQSPVTLADKEAERIIVEEIREAFGDHRILGEEEGLSAGKSEYLWIVDPIDGTKNYTRRLPLFATLVGLMKNEEMIVGVSSAPAMGELMYGEKGGGCYCNDMKCKVSDIGSLDEAYVSHGGLASFEREKKVENLLKLMRSVRAGRGFGDFWSYHLLAQGKIDVVIEARTKIWDVAAVSLLVEEAGGKVTDINGKKLDRNTTSIVATNGQLHEEVLEIMSV